jgi:hypothetical protein
MVENIVRGKTQIKHNIFFVFRGSPPLIFFFVIHTNFTKYQTFGTLWLLLGNVPVRCIGLIFIKYLCRSYGLNKYIGEKNTGTSDNLIFSYAIIKKINFSDEPCITSLKSILHGRIET